ncbi:MAG: HipA N-terminal domain-containing protein [Chitinophagaceae bacterium]
MLRKILNWFSKGEDEYVVPLPKDEDAKFVLLVDDIRIGVLYCEKSEWYFKYSEDFKNRSEYNRIVGFPDLNKTYKSDTLWPFFQIRIPGLKQPAIKEILEKEKIDKTNEVELLRRFGHKSISNPYELVME